MATFLRVVLTEKKGLYVEKFRKEILQCSLQLKCGDNPEKGYEDLAEKIEPFDRGFL